MACAPGGETRPAYAGQVCPNQVYQASLFDLDQQIGRLLDWLKGRATYGDYVRACLGADVAAYKALQQPVLVCAADGDALTQHADRIVNALPNAQRVESNDDPMPLATAIATFLD